MRGHVTAAWMGGRGNLIIFSAVLTAVSRSMTDAQILPVSSPACFSPDRGAADQDLLHAADKRAGAE